MIKYITNIKEDYVILDIMGRKKTFYKNQEVDENVYTKAYSKLFKKIGITTGYNYNLSTPVFIPDQISEFVSKEAERKIIKEPTEQLTINETEVKEFVEVGIDEIFIGKESTPEDININKEDIYNG